MRPLLSWSTGVDLSEPEEVELDCPNCLAEGYATLQDRRYTGFLFTLIPILSTRNTRVVCLRCKTEFSSLKNAAGFKILDNKQAQRVLVKPTNALGSSLLLTTFFTTIIPFVGLFFAMLAIVHNKAGRFSVRALSWFLLCLQFLWTPLFFGVTPKKEHLKWLGIQILPSLEEIPTARLDSLVYASKSETAPFKLRKAASLELFTRFREEAEVSDVARSHLESPELKMRMLALNVLGSLKLKEDLGVQALGTSFQSPTYTDAQFTEAFQELDSRSSVVLAGLLGQLDKGPEQLILKTLLRFPFKKIQPTVKGTLETKLVGFLGGPREDALGEELLIRLLTESQNWALLEARCKVKLKLRERLPDLYLKVPGEESANLLLELHLSETLPRTYRGRCLKRFYSEPLAIIEALSKELSGRSPENHKRRLIAITLLSGMNREAKKKALPALIKAIADQDLSIAQSALGITKFFGTLPQEGVEPLRQLLGREKFGWSTRSLYRKLGPRAIPVFVDRVMRGASINQKAEGLQALQDYGAVAKSALPFLDDLAKGKNQTLARKAREAAAKIRLELKKS
ncbi:MAG: hypothetical protein P1V97_17275 [Planctomycetota bacterium]|nr:hypothetical protein [Planctomycetota bacterium]